MIAYGLRWKLKATQFPSYNKGLLTIGTLWQKVPTKLLLRVSPPLPPDPILSANSMWDVWFEGHSSPRNSNPPTVPYLFLSPMVLPRGHAAGTGGIDATLRNWHYVESASRCMDTRINMAFGKRPPRINTDSHLKVKWLKVTHFS